MKTFTLETVTPEGALVVEDVEYVVLPSSGGPYGILINHLPVVLRLETGICEYVRKGVETRLFLTDGVADVTRDKVIVLSDFIAPEENAESALREREEFFEREKLRRKNFCEGYKKTDLALMKALKKAFAKRRELTV